MSRAARAGDGWIGLVHDRESVAAPIARLRELRKLAGHEHERFEVTIGGRVERRDDIKRWEDAGVDRLVVSPWRRSPEALEGVRRYAELVLSAS